MRSTTRSSPSASWPTSSHSRRPIFAHWYVPVGPRFRVEILEHRRYRPFWRQAQKAALRSRRLPWRYYGGLNPHKPAVPVDGFVGTLGLQHAKQPCSMLSMVRCACTQASRSSPASKVGITVISYILRISASSPSWPRSCARARRKAPLARQAPTSFLPCWNGGAAAIFGRASPDESRSPTEQLDLRMGKSLGCHGNSSP